MLKQVADRLKKFFERPSDRGSDGVAILFAAQDQPSEDELLILSLIKSLLPADHRERERALARFRASLERHDIPERKIVKLLALLRQIAPETPEKVLPALKKYDCQQHHKLLESMLVLIIEREEYRPEQYRMLAGIAAGIGFDADEFSEIAENVKRTVNNRSRILRSGTGIVLALVVIGLFVLIATWLSSLLFGLVLAYVFLPLEQFFERKLRKEPGRVTRFLRRLNVLKLISDKIRRKSEFELSQEEIELRKQRMITTQATTLTVSCVVIGFVTLLIALSLLLVGYVSKLRYEYKVAHQKKVQVESIAAAGSMTKVSGGTAVGKETVSDSDFRVQIDDYEGSDSNAVSPVPKGYFSGMSANLVGFLDNVKERFQSMPLVKSIINKLSEYLADGKFEEQLTAMVLKRSGGVWAFIGNFITAFASFLLNLLMTFFFFSLLLNKLALFINSRKDKKQRASSYIIQTIFNGKWLPQMSEENIREGDRIVGEVINKLRVWLRGYMTMIAIDYCVYTTAFILLGIPYAPILGAVAAVGILLPYIGPIGSALLTVLVTLAVGGADVTVVQIAGALAVYLIHNGIIEQFFIYPWIIGESLGLSTLETIIVVLLGGILAGIPGMIFAMPVASVIKYLVPQIYRCWR